MLQVRGLTKSFGGLLAVSSLDFDISEKELVGLIGPNGSGKSTTVNLLTGFYKPDRGSIIFDGHELQGRPAYKISKMGIARTFQLPRPLKKMTALENVMSGCIFGRGKEKAMHSAREAATKILEKVGLANQAEVAAQFLTPSQCRRLEIARAMSTSPKLLLLDEAMAGLDADEAEDIMSLVRVIRESGVAVMIIEHVMRVVLSLSERIIVLNNGRKIFEGKPEEVIKDGSVLAAYLGGRFVPQ